MIIFILLSSFAIIAIIFHYGLKKPEIEFKDDFIRIEAYSGKITEISKIELTEHLPEIHIRLLGFSAAGILKGRFRTTSGEDIMLSVDANSKPFICIEFRYSQKVFVNFKNPNDTIACYDSIIAKLK